MKTFAEWWESQPEWVTKAPGRRQRWWAGQPIQLRALIIGAPAGLALWGLKSLIDASRMCGTGPFQAKLQTDGALGCAEFWLNRYQSLIGSALTVLISAIAAVIILRQLKAMADQTAIATNTLRLANTQVEAAAHAATIEKRRNLAIAILALEEYQRAVFSLWSGFWNIRNSPEKNFGALSPNHKACMEARSGVLRNALPHLEPHDLADAVRIDEKMRGVLNFARHEIEIYDGVLKFMDARDQPYRTIDEAEPELAKLDGEIGLLLDRTRDLLGHHSRAH